VKCPAITAETVDEERPRMKDRFSKLAALTRGAAIITLSAGAAAAAACSKTEPPPVPPTVNGPAPSAAPAIEDADAGAAIRRFPPPNAVRRWPPGSGNAGGADAGP
jgi:hypothetical protein